MTGGLGKGVADIRVGYKCVFSPEGEALLPRHLLCARLMREFAAAVLHPRPHPHVSDKETEAHSWSGT